MVLRVRDMRSCSEYDATYQGKPDQGRFMAVWKKNGDSWKIVRDSWYSNQ
jgi:ketosteroid isomerase-like protein